MQKPRQTLNISNTSLVEDGDMRSPRTPTYAPSSTSFFNPPPFDPSRVFLSLSPTSPIEQPPPPKKPLAWVWQCHLCRSRYPLGTTRRCLLDGHFYCSGETDRPNLKKKKKGQSCSSEFDYVGWKSMEQWKRKVRNSERFLIARERQGCEHCEFPSQCRYAIPRPPRQDSGSSDMTEIDLSTASAPRSADGADSMSRFYKNDKDTFDSILASSGQETSAPRQSKVTEYYKSDRKSQTRGGRTSTAAALREITKSAERRLGAQNSLSPIQEEFSKIDQDMPDVEDTMEFIMPDPGT